MSPHRLPVACHYQRHPLPRVPLMRKSFSVTKRCSSISSGSSRKNWRTVRPKKNWTHFFVSLSPFRQYHPRALQVGVRPCLSCHLTHSARQPSLRVASVNTCLNTSARKFLTIPPCTTSGPVAKRNLRTQNERRTTTATTTTAATIS